MVIMIFIKWIKYAATYDGVGKLPQTLNCTELIVEIADFKLGSQCAPSVLIYFIDMMLFGDSGNLPDDCDKYMFDSQVSVQRILVYGALICIPWMLMGKPIYIILTRRKKAAVVKVMKKKSCTTKVASTIY